MAWTYDEALRLQRPLFSNEFVKGKALESLEISHGSASVDEVLKTVSQSVVALEPIDGCVLDGAVYSLDQSVCPWAIDACEPVFNAVLGKYGADFVGQGLISATKKVEAAVGSLLCQLNEGELGGSVNGDKEMEFAFGSPPLGKVDGKAADK